MPKTTAKRSRTNSPAEQMTTTPPPQESQALKPFFEPSEMSRTHELIIDAVAEMLSHGGHEQDIEALLYATMRHTRRRNYPDDCERSRSAVAEFAMRDIEQWKLDLAIAWRRNAELRSMVFAQVFAPAPFTGQTVSELIRFNLRGYVWSSFAEFLEAAS